MKKKSVFTFCFLVACLSVNAQIIRRTIKFTPIGRDSINMSFNNNYELIDDSCATIIRYTHFNFKTHHFFGWFKDVSKQNPSVVLAEGYYTDEQHKDGDFISRYPNGNIHSKGKYKNDAYDGHWEVNNADGKPQLIFDAENGIIKITDAWDAKGKQTVINGNGSYSSGNTLPKWSGKIVNGRPDGKWKAFNPADPYQPTLLTEQFEKGQFKGGTSPLSEYIDRSRMIFFNSDITLPYTLAETLAVSRNDCNTPDVSITGNIVSAKYQNGFDSFNDEIKKAVVGYLSKVDLRAYNRNLVFTGIIDKKGNIRNLKYDGPVNDDIARHIVFELGRLPVLDPATLNNKPIPQNFTITFTFEDGYYRFSYRFLSVIKD